jgi:hypothetical protein
VVAPFGPNDPAFLNFDSSAPPPTNRAVRSPGRRGERPRDNGGTPDLIEVPFWDGPDGDAWDRITLGQYRFRGTVVVDGSGPGQKLDTRSAPGSDGARFITKGYEPAEFRLKLRVWTEEQLQDFEDLVVEIHPKRNPGLRNALDVYHPSLALLQIGRAIIKRVGMLKPSGTAGLMECELDCVEFAEPSRQSVTRRVQPPRAQSFADRAIDPRFRTDGAQDDPNTIAPPSQTNAAP